jgi:hypothetical protein
VVDSGDLFTYYRTAAQLVKEKYFTITELENMMPFEMPVYIDIINIMKKEAKDKASRTSM